MDITTVTIDPARLALSVMAGTMDIEKASNACKEVSEWAKGKPIDVRLSDKAGRYSVGKQYRRCITFDEAVLQQLDEKIAAMINGA